MITTILGIGAIIVISWAAIRSKLRRIKEDSYQKQLDYTTFLNTVYGMIDVWLLAVNVHYEAISVDRFYRPPENPTELAIRGYARDMSKLLEENINKYITTYHVSTRYIFNNLLREQLQDKYPDKYQHMKNCLGPNV